MQEASQVTTAGQLAEILGIPDLNHCVEYIVSAEVDEPLRVTAHYRVVTLEGTEESARKFTLTTADE